MFFDENFLRGTYINVVEISHLYKYIRDGQLTGFAH